MDAEQFDLVDTFTADDRGRITLGSEWAGAKVRAFVEDMAAKAENMEAVPEEESEVLSDMAQWARDQGYSPMGYRPHEGKILSKDSEWIETPYSLEDK